MITLVVGILGALLTIAKLAWSLFSPKARLRHLELWIERQKALNQSESSRQDDDNARIDTQPPKTGQELLDDLNEKFK